MLSEFLFIVETLSLDKISASPLPQNFLISFYFSSNTDVYGRLSPYIVYILGVFFVETTIYKCITI